MFLITYIGTRKKNLYFCMRDSRVNNDRLRVAPAVLLLYHCSAFPFGVSPSKTVSPPTKETFYIWILIKRKKKIGFKKSYGDLKIS